MTEHVSERHSFDDTGWEELTSFDISFFPYHIRFSIARNVRIDFAVIFRWLFGVWTFLFRRSRQENGFGNGFRSWRRPLRRLERRAATWSVHARPAAGVHRAESRRPGPPARARPGAPAAPPRAASLALPQALGEHTRLLTENLRNHHKHSGELSAPKVAWYIRVGNSFDTLLNILCAASFYLGMKLI